MEKEYKNQLVLSDYLLNNLSYLNFELNPKVLKYFLENNIKTIFGKDKFDEVKTNYQYGELEELIVNGLDLVDIVFEIGTNLDKMKIQFNSLPYKFEESYEKLLSIAKKLYEKIYGLNEESLEKNSEKVDISLEKNNHISVIKSQLDNKKLILSLNNLVESLKISLNEFIRKYGIFGVKEKNNYEIEINKVSKKKEDKTKNNIISLVYQGDEYYIYLNNENKLVMTDKNGQILFEISKDKKTINNVLVTTFDEGSIWECQKISFGNDEYYEYQKIINNKEQVIYPALKVRPIGVKLGNKLFFEILRSNEKSLTKQKSLLNTIVERLKNNNILEFEIPLDTTGNMENIDYLDKIFKEMKQRSNIESSSLKRKK